MWNRWKNEFRCGSISQCQCWRCDTELHQNSAPGSGLCQHQAHKGINLLSSGTEWLWENIITEGDWWNNNLYLSRSDQVILGLLSPDTGHVDVSPDLEVPGPGVGLMPQALALHPYFSCREILWYYASLAGVLPVMIDTRIATILRFLKLSAKVGPTSLLETDVNWRNQGKWSSEHTEWGPAAPPLPGMFHCPLSRPGHPGRANCGHWSPPQGGDLGSAEVNSCWGVHRYTARLSFNLNSISLKYPSTMTMCCFL